MAAVSLFERDHGAFSPAEIADADERAARAIQRPGTGTSPRARVPDGRHQRQLARLSPPTAASAACGPATAPSQSTAKLA
jgi:hypothetical protein